MKKKTTIRILSTLFLSISLGVVACGGNGGQQSHTHTFSSEWSYDETYHWHDATCGHTVISDLEEHTFSDVTDSDTGKVLHTCSICGYSFSDSYANRIYTSSDAVTMVKGGIDVITKPVVFPSGSYENFKYLSSDQDIISVLNGVVSAKEIGDAVVTIYNDNDNDNVFDVDEPATYVGYQVVERSDINVTVNLSEANLEIGDELAFTIDVSGDDVESGTRYYSYTSTNPSVANARNNKIYGLKEGETDIYVNYKGHPSQPIHVTVSFDMEGNKCGPIHLDKDTINLSSNEEQIVYLSMSTHDWKQNNTVSSNNESVATATIDKASKAIKVTAHEAGSAIITVTSSIGRTARLLVNVKENQTYNPQSYYDNYYQNLSWTNSKDLISKLHAIISKNKTSIKYDGNWEQNQAADENDYYRDVVNTIYSTKDFGKTQTNTQGWQREHAFAASLMTGINSGTAIKTLGRATDFHNLISAYYSGNTSRGNKSFGYVDSFGTGYVSSLDNPYGDYQYEEGKTGNFEPNDVDKGQLARAIFYMAVMYNEPELGFNGYTYKPLDIVEPNVSFSISRLTTDAFTSNATGPKGVLGNKYRELVKKEHSSASETEISALAYQKYIETNSPYAFGNLKDLLKWNAFDVSLAEYKHNQRVFDTTTSQGKQGNRNPFVDYPELVEYAFGSLKNTAGSLANLKPSIESLGLTDASKVHHLSVTNSMNIKYDVGDTLTVASIVEKAGIRIVKSNFEYASGDVGEQISSITPSNYVFTQDDVENGKDIIVNTKIGESLKLHIIVNDPDAITFETCKFSYRPSGDTPKSDYSGSGTNWVATFSGVKFDVTFGQATSYFQNRKESSNPDSCGVTIGSNNNPINSFTLVSQSSYTNVNAIFFYALTNKDVTVPYKIYVGDIEVLSGDIFSNTPTFYGGTFNAVSGKIKIELTDVKGFSFCGLAFNY